MNQIEFLEKWTAEKTSYQKWGDFVVSKVSEGITNSGFDIGNFIKLPPTARVKDDKSLIDKAFYRPNKNYSDPYEEIEDKVGCRFVLLLVDHVEAVAKIIRETALWDAVECRHFSEERNKDPLLFTYQSVHYVVRPKQPIEFQGVQIPSGIPCEIQIRTLLQHAYAELTHDSIYKANKDVKSEIHRTVAKSMALIETTDDFFSEVSNKLTGPIETLDIVNTLDSMYEEFVGYKPITFQKSSMEALDAFEELFESNFSQRMRRILANEEYCLPELIRSKSKDNPFFQQSISIFTCWLLLEKRTTLKKNWPLDRKIIEELASTLSVSLDDY